MSHPRRQQTLRTLLRGCLLLLLPAILLLAFEARAQNQATADPNSLRSDYSVSFFGSINEDVRIFLFPQSPDPVLRQQTEILGSAYSAALSWRYRVLPTLSLDLRGEYATVEKSTTDAVGTAILHGMDAYLLEGSALFSLPFSTRRFEMYVGGGLGVYTGSRLYRIGEALAEHVSSTPAIGLHVTVGAEYILHAGLGLRFELVFRDPQISVDNRFSQPAITANSVTYPLQTEPFRSQVNMNGNVYSLAVFYSF